MSTRAALIIALGAVTWSGCSHSHPEQAYSPRPFSSATNAPQPGSGGYVAVATITDASQAPAVGTSGVNESTFNTTPRSKEAFRPYEKEDEVVVASNKTPPTKIVVSEVVVPPPMTATVVASAAPTLEPLSPAVRLLTFEEASALLESMAREESAQAKLAVDKTDDLDIRRFAQGIVRENSTSHGASMVVSKEPTGKSDKVASSDKMAPDDVYRLTSNAERSVRDLRKKNGSRFDRAYLKTVVQREKDALALIDNKLLPRADSLETKSLLRTARPRVLDRMRQAERLLESYDEPKSH